LSKPTTPEYIRGSLYGLVAVSIWASWIVAVRLGIRTSLAPWDITAIRFGVAGLTLLPYLLNKGLAVDRLGWAGLAAIMLGGGAPMVLVSYGGLLFAPAAHAASLYTALIPLYVAILAAVVIGETFSVAKQIGLVLIVTGVLGIVWSAGGTIGSRQNIGHAMFIGAGMLWAGYTVAMRRARLGGLHAAAIAAVGSLITYVPVYAIIFGASLFNAPWRDLALQAFVHGLLVAVISLLLYGRAVSILGASNGSAFAALSPAITAILAIPILGEWPATSDWIAMLLISGGVYIASGAPLPVRRVGWVPSHPRADNQSQLAAGFGSRKRCWMGRRTPRGFRWKESIAGVGDPDRQAERREGRLLKSLKGREPVHAAAAACLKSLSLKDLRAAKF
jgi:drug/metabolite transporter (DMT)-like permease